MIRPEVLTSTANPLLKDLRRAVMRGEATGQGYWIAETLHLLEEALRSAVDVKVVLTAESVRTAVEERVRNRSGVRLVVVPEELLRRVSESSQGVITLISPPEWTLEQVLGGRSLVVVLNGIQDPGNAGTITRAAEAFGATGVIFVKGTVFPFHPKTLRAAAGSLFRLPFVYGLDESLTRAALQRPGLALYAAMPPGCNGTKSLIHADLSRDCGIVIGNEGHGVGEVLRAGAVDLSIPTAGVNSLNAAMAASILLYEARRQRSLQS